jgi:hypothetical protein
VQPSGVANILFVELVYNAATGAWVPVQATDWLSYTNNFALDLQLFPRNGLRYIQAWSSDAEANISRFPFQRQINLSQSCTGVTRNGTDVYRQNLAQGQQLYVEVVPCQGDADLYIWPPDWDPTQPGGGRPPYVSNQTNDATEVISLTAPVDGVYAVEVYGFTTSEYTIQVEPQPVSSQATGSLAAVTDYETGGISQEKTVPDAPTLPWDSSPPVAMGVPPAPITLEQTEPEPEPSLHSVYLPVVQVQR